MMAKQIKVGMLCYLTKVMLPENNGIPVTVVERHQCTDEPSFGWRPYEWGWLVSTTHPIKAKDAAGNLTTSKINLVREYQLIPIDADPDGVGDESSAWL